MKKVSLFVLIIVNAFFTFADYDYYYSPEIRKQLAHLLSCLQHEDIDLIIRTVTEDMPFDEFSNKISCRLRENRPQLFAITAEPKDIMHELLEDVHMWYAERNINFYERFEQSFRYFLCRQNEVFLTNLVHVAKGSVSFQLLLRMIVTPSCEASNLEKYLITRVFERLSSKIQFDILAEIQEVIGSENYRAISGSCMNLDDLLKKLDIWFLKSWNSSLYKNFLLEKLYFYIDVFLGRYPPAAAA